jgi:hypothetical protein
MMGVRTVVLAPDAGAGIRPQHVDEWVDLRDVADDRPLPEPRKGDESVMTIERYFAEPLPWMTNEMDRLERRDPETYEWLERILTVTDETRAEVLRTLRGNAERGTLPSLVIATLFILASASREPGEDRRVRKNRYYHRLTRYDIDVDTVGRLALSLLAEEGTLTAVVHPHDMEYRYERDPHDPAHELARAFCDGMMRRRNRIAFLRSRTDYADQVLQAFEIFSVDPGNLTPDAIKDIRDFAHLLVTSLDNEDRFRSYQERGFTSKQEMVHFERQLGEILTSPPSASGEDIADDDAAEPPTPSSECVADTEGGGRDAYAARKSA